MLNGQKKKTAKRETIKVLPKRNNTTSGAKAHNDNVIYKGSGTSFLLVVKRPVLSSQAAIELTVVSRKTNIK